LDFNVKDEMEAKYLASLSGPDRTIIEQEKGAEFDLVAREFKTAKLALAPYWNLGDDTARKMGFDNSQDMAVNGTVWEKKQYAKASATVKEQYRRANPEIDALLIRWEYASKPILEQGTGSRSRGSSRVSRPTRKVTRAALR